MQGEGHFIPVQFWNNSADGVKCPLDVLVSNFPSTQVYFQPHSVLLEDSPMIGALTGLYAVCFMQLHAARASHEWPREVVGR